MWGDGTQRRDLLYVDDAVRAFLLAAARGEADGEVFNVGVDASVSLLELAELLVSLHAGGVYRTIPFPAERQAIDIGDYFTDARKIHAALGWEASVSLRDGLARTLAYYARAWRVVLGRVREGPVPRSLQRSRSAARGARRGVWRASSTPAVSCWPTACSSSRSLSPQFCGSGEAVGVASGTDALTIALRAVGVGPRRRGDRARQHLRPDGGRHRGRRRATRSSPTSTRSPGRSTRPRPLRALTERTRAVVPVHLYGLCADIDGVLARARARDRRGRRAGPRRRAATAGGRLARRRGGVQLLPDQEPRRVRRRRGDRDGRPGRRP